MAILIVQMSLMEDYMMVIVRLELSGRSLHCPISLNLPPHFSNKFAFQSSSLPEIDAVSLFLNSFGL